jgi:hypothetical protein
VRLAVRIWSVPAALASTTVLGLVSALLADGWADTLSWLALALPVVVILWCIAAARQTRTL